MIIFKIYNKCINYIFKRVKSDKLNKIVKNILKNFSIDFLNT